MTVAATSNKSMRQQFADTMLEVGREDPALVVLIGDISHFIMQPFAQACPGRFYNIGICEPTIISMGAGLAKVNLVPVMHTIAPFLLERSLEQIKLDFCYHKLSGNLITVGSAFDYANLGCTHHCYDDFALFKTLEGAQAIYPASPVEFNTLFRQTYRNGAVTLFRLPTAQHGYEFDAEDIHFGKGLKIRDGSNLTIVATGPHLKDALASCDGLQALGWDPEIIYLHTIIPMDAELVVESVRKTRRVLVIEEHMANGGVGDDVLKAVYGMGHIGFASISIPNKFVRGYGHYEDHCATLGFTPQGILDRVQGSFRR
jgi:transketolase